MEVPLYAKIGSIVLAALSLFWLPWICSLVLIFTSGLVTPIAALALGVFADLLYYPGHGLPLGATAGCIIAVITALMRHFIRTRIM